MMSIEELDERKQERTVEARQKLAKYGDQYLPWIREALQDVVARGNPKIYVPDGCEKTYEIVNTVNDEVFTGTTKMSLNRRLRLHLSERHPKSLYDDMKRLGVDKFKIRLKSIPDVKPKYANLPDSSWLSR